MTFGSKTETTFLHVHEDGPAEMVATSAPGTTSLDPKTFTVLEFFKCERCDTQVAVGRKVTSDTEWPGRPTRTDGT
jgi:hypothetical protein